MWMVTKSWEHSVVILSVTCCREQEELEWANGERSWHERKAVTALQWPLSSRMHEACHSWWRWVVSPHLSPLPTNPPISPTSTFPHAKQEAPNSITFLVTTKCRSCQQISQCFLHVPTKRLVNVFSKFCNVLFCVRLQSSWIHYHSGQSSYLVVWDKGGKSRWSLVHGNHQIPFGSQQDACITLSPWQTNTC
jgi:hypothetical protein